MNNKKIEKRWILPNSSQKQVELNITQKDLVILFNTMVDLIDKEEARGEYCYDNRMVLEKLHDEIRKTE